MNDSIIEKVKRSENELRLAMLNSDLAELERLLSENLVFINHQGAYFSKKDDIEMHASGLIDIQSIGLSEYRYQVIESTIVVSAKANIDGIFDGHEANAQLRFSRLWAYETINGVKALRIRFAQSTQLAVE